MPAAQAEGKTRALVLPKTSPRGTQAVALGGYLFEAALSRSWPEKGGDRRSWRGPDPRERGPGEFYILGSGLTVNFIRDPDVDSGMAGIASVEQVTRHGGKWTTERWLNGDQTKKGSELLTDPHQPRIYRVRWYAIPSERH